MKIITSNRENLVITNNEVYLICYENNNEIYDITTNLENAKNKLQKIQEENPHIAYILRKFKEVYE